MQCDEKRQICLNYASNVPEWQTALQLDAIKKLNKAAQMCNRLSAMIAGGLSYDKLHPDNNYYSEPVAGFNLACNNAAGSFGEAVCALEELMAQADLFGAAQQIARYVEVSYSAAQLELEDMCRKHGCPEVAYKHG